MDTAGDLSLLQNVQTCSGAHPSLLQWIMRMLSVTVMQPQNEADHSHSSSVEFKNEWSYTSPHPYALIAGTGTLSESHAHHGSNNHKINVCQRH
jgi:hypothetical protein